MEFACVLLVWPPRHNTEWPLSVPAALPGDGVAFPPAVYPSLLTSSFRKLAVPPLPRTVHEGLFSTNSSHLWQARPGGVMVQ